MATSQYLRGVHEIKCHGIIHLDEPQSVKTIKLLLWDPFKPPHMQEVHPPQQVVLHPWANVLNISVIYSNDAGITKLTMIVLRLWPVKHHNITVLGVQIEDIIGTMNIICCVVDPKDVMSINLIVSEYRVICMCV
jgi:hypothetical protein